MLLVYRAPMAASSAGGFRCSLPATAKSWFQTVRGMSEVAPSNFPGSTLRIAKTVTRLQMSTTLSVSVASHPRRQPRQVLAAVWTPRQVGFCSAYRARTALIVTDIRCVLRSRGFTVRTTLCRKSLCATPLRSGTQRSMTVKSAPVEKAVRCPQPRWQRVAATSAGS